jgi:hypothetical protein
VADFDFPSSVPIGATVTGASGGIYQWDGVKWVGGGSAAVPAWPSDAPPVMDGVAAPGVSTYFSRGDHVHPSDTSRVPFTGGSMSGALALFAGSTTPTVAPATDSSLDIASTAFVQGAIAAAASSTVPLIDAGAGGAGTGVTWARADHVHPMARLDQILAPAANVSLNGFSIIGMADPVDPQDATNKSYVDALIQGMTVKPTATYATTAALPANTYSNGTLGRGATLTGTGVGALVVDGASVTTGQLILVHNEAAAANNGLYVVTQPGSATTPYILTRNNQMDQSTEMSGALVAVESGTVFANSLWLSNPTTPVVIGTTAIPWTQLNNPTALVAGNGISIVGNLISAKPYTGISVTAAGIGIDPAYIGQTSITTLGTITTGVWNAGAITAPSLTGTTSAAVLDNFIIDGGTF